MNKIIIFIFLFFRIANCVSQNMANSAMIEQKSTELYIAHNWAELINYGNEAIAQGYDYFYLRMRIGIAYYEQKKYMKGVRHFEKAVQFNSSDKVALEYLYYSYVFSGRNNEARALKSMFSERMLDLLKPPSNKIFESLYCEGGIALSNQNNIYKNIDLNGPSNIYGAALITNNMHYWHVGLNHQLGNKLSVYEGFCNINIDMASKISANNKDTLDNYTLTQNDYYLSPNYQFKYFSISPAIHFINVNFGKLNAYRINNTHRYAFTKKDTTFSNYATSLSITKNIGIYSYNLTGGFSQLNGYNQIQTGLSLTYYPLTNTDFYGTSSLVYLNENYTNRFIVIQKIGLKLAPKLWAEAGITYGDLQNYCENNAFVVYNTGDKILYKYGFSIVSPLLKHVEFSLRYDSFYKENTYDRTDQKMKYVYGLPNYFLETESITINYKTQTIIGGIKWKF